MALKKNPQPWKTLKSRFQARNLRRLNSPSNTCERRNTSSSFRIVSGVMTWKAY